MDYSRFKNQKPKNTIKAQEEIQKTEIAKKYLGHVLKAVYLCLRDAELYKYVESDFKSYNEKSSVENNDNKNDVYKKHSDNIIYLFENSSQSSENFSEKRVKISSFLKEIKQLNEEDIRNLLGLCQKIYLEIQNNKAEEDFQDDLVSSFSEITDEELLQNSNLNKIVESKAIIEDQDSHEIYDLSEFEDLFLSEEDYQENQIRSIDLLYEEFNNILVKKGLHPEKIGEIVKEFELLLIELDIEIMDGLY